MRKLGFRIDHQGLYVPQYTNGKDEWIDFKLKDLGTGELLNIVRLLGMERRWDVVYHYHPDKDQKKEDMVIFFKNSMRLHAFLGAIRNQWDNEKTIEIKNLNEQR